ncbi:MAG: Predicted AAA-ATPase, partial [Candidatus Kentron sp. G]
GPPLPGDIGFVGAGHARDGKNSCSFVDRQSRKRARKTRNGRVVVRKEKKDSSPRKTSSSGVLDFARQIETQSAKMHATFNLGQPRAQKMKFPYGISDFDSLITEQYHYVDRTGHIPLLEEAGKQLLFLRPRRFGKSLLLSMLENYYDLNKAERFEELFGDLAIGRNPTAEHNRYFVLKWDFSEVSAAGDAKEIKQNLYRYLNDRIRAFAKYYRAILSDSIQLNPKDALASFRSLLDATRESGHPLYLLIDEYDNFANELMMGHGSTEESRYQAILSGEGCMKALFKNVKASAGTRGIGRVFITGVSPVVMSDLTVTSFEIRGTLSHDQAWVPDGAHGRS